MVLTLALSPIRDTLIEGFSHFVTSMTAPIASGWSGCRVGFAPTGKRRLCTAHANSGPSSTLDKRRKVRSNTLLGWRCIVAPYAGMRVSSVVSFSRSNFRPASCCDFLIQGLGGLLPVDPGGGR
jgi:hypothetical protein